MSPTLLFTGMHKTQCDLPGQLSCVHDRILSELAVRNVWICRDLYRDQGTKSQGTYCWVYEAMLSVSNEQLHIQM